MNNSGSFSNNPPAALMSYPFALPTPSQHHSLMDQSYLNQPPPPFQQHPARFYNSRSTMQTPKAEKRKQEILTCDACGIEVNSQQMMDAHIRGQKHIKKMKLKAVSAATPVVNSTPTVASSDQSYTNSPVPSANITTESAQSNESNPPVTPATKSTATNEKSVLQLMNELAKYNKVNTKYDLIKETGPAHCKQFEVRLTVADETYIGIGTSIKRAQQVAAEIALASTALKKPESSHRGSHTARPPRGGPQSRGMYPNVRHQHSSQPTRSKLPMSPGQQQQQTLSNYENLMNNKYLEISENENTIIQIHHFVEEIERALKTVSDKIMEQCKLNNTPIVPKLPENVKLNSVEQSDEDSTESFRMLKGAMKVSTLAMRIFLKIDNEYSLVLICANKPTVALLNKICQELTIGLNAQAIAALQLDSNDEKSTPATYQVEAHINDACLTVQCSLLPKHTIRIMLTSPVFRSENFTNLDDNTRQQIAELNPDPIDMLDKNKCLEAAAEIRHSNWFTRCMLENSANLIVLRLLRDLQHNQTPLSSLTLWSLVLLVYKCHNQPPTSAISLFRSVFSCLSSGILLPDCIGHGINDPCEKEPVDAASYLTLEQRLDITNYAQHMLRLIAFEKYETIFQLELNQAEPFLTPSTFKVHQTE